MKRLKNIEGKNKQQLEAIKDQEEKQLQTFTKKTNQVDDFKNVSYRNELNSEAKKAYDKIRKQGKKIKYTELISTGSSAKHRYNFTIFLDLKTFAESLYNGSVSLEVAKLKKRNMENEIERLEDYNPKKEEIKTQKKMFFRKCK